ncbi:MAG: hypothetical protein WBY44_12255 [Bryobacteraceae bacterium]
MGIILILPAHCCAGTIGEGAKDRKCPEANLETRFVKDRFRRDFDIEFWHEQGDGAIFQAAWETVNCGRVQVWSKARTTKIGYNSSTIARLSILL